MTTRRQMLLPLVPLYAAGLRVERWLQTVQWLRRVQPQRYRALKSAVISVGSISAGGAGKTPVVLALAGILSESGYGVRILTRGYKRDSKVVERVDPAGDARRFGDEPMLLARRSGLPVYVGADRYAAGRMAENGGEGGGGMIVHLLDDGFQHRRLARDLDVVLLTRKEVNDRLLPAGDLREPLTALREADVIVLREDEAESLEEFISVLTRETGKPAIWRIRRSLRFERGGVARTKRPLAFCGIARPESFTAMLEGEGLTPAAVVRFDDHHRYTERDIDRLLEAARAAKADGFVTTEKDAVKLTGAMRSRLEEQGPLLAPLLEVMLTDERTALQQMIRMVGRLDRRRGR